VDVLVTVDGAPARGAAVLQGGGDSAARTDAAGRARVRIDPGREGETWIVAALPGHRSDGVELLDAWPTTSPVAIELAPVPTDNPDYFYGDPGVEVEHGSSEFCSHCHPTLATQFGRSAHRRAASNPAVQDLYEPGDSCADCHAPGVDGPAVAGRSLLEATDLARSDGVHCDLCHKIADVRLDQPPGPGRRLVLGRPTDGPGPLSDFRPAMYGPYPDVLNPFMGGVWTPLFREARFCGGCHEHTREGLPIQTTLSEFEASGMADGASCRDCHMPPVDLVNAADLDREYSEPSASAGFARAPGEVRDHSFPGALDRGPSGRRLIEDAARLSIDARREGDAVVADVTATVVGAAHRVPTGEPMRTLVLVVEASGCGQPLAQSGGPRIDTTGGAMEPSSMGGLPRDGAPVRGLQEMAGRTYARVLVDEAGDRVHHGRAARELRDDRLTPGQPTTDSFRFALPAGCDDAAVDAVLLYRRYPLDLARRFEWPQVEVVAAEAHQDAPPTE